MTTHPDPDRDVALVVLGVLLFAMVTARLVVAVLRALLDRDRAAVDAAAERLAAGPRWARHPMHCPRQHETRRR